MTARSMRLAMMHDPAADPRPARSPRPGRRLSMPMLHRTVTTCALACALAGCGAARTPPADPLVGVWRVATFETWDSAGSVARPYGDRPSGYAVFDPAGLAFIQMMAVDGGEPRPSTYISYYGPFDTDAAGTTLTVRVEGSNRAGYLGTEQVRRYSVAGDTLRLGIPGEYQATLGRVTARPD